MKQFVQRFFQALPEKDVPVGEKWKATRETKAVLLPPDFLAPIGQFEETYFVKGVEDRVATVIVTCKGTEKSPRADHKKGRWKTSGRESGLVDEKWNYTGSVQIDVGSGLWLGRNVRGKSTVYDWLINDGKPERLELTNREYASKLRLVERIAPAWRRDGDK